MFPVLLSSSFAPHIICKRQPIDEVTLCRYVALYLMYLSSSIFPYVLRYLMPFGGGVTSRFKVSRPLFLQHGPSSFDLIFTSNLPLSRLTGQIDEQKCSFCQQAWQREISKLDSSMAIHYPCLIEITYLDQNQV